VDRVAAGGKTSVVFVHVPAAARPGLIRTPGGVNQQEAAMQYRTLALFLALIGTCAPGWAQQIGPRDLDALPVTRPTLVERYGPARLQFGELRIPRGEGPCPVVVVIHGGCWLEKFADLRNLAPVASDLQEIGIATWNIEYRRNDNGGGWPATFTDVGSAVDHLRSLSKRYPLDLSRVVAIGHSAGAPLAVWAAGRGGVERGSPIRGDDPLPVKAAVAIDGPLDLAQWIGEEVEVCGQPVIAPLFGGAPDEVPERYRQASPIQMLPVGAPVYLVRSALVTEPDATAYETRARVAGDRVMVVPVAGANHFDVVAPGQAQYWPVREAIQAAVNSSPEQR